jgi:hypothetical protein
LIHESCFNAIRRCRSISEGDRRQVDQID